MLQSALQYHAGAQYRITVWALGNGSRSATPAVESVTTEETSDLYSASDAAQCYAYLYKFCAALLLHPLMSNSPPPKNCLPSYPVDPSPLRNVTIIRVFRDSVELNWLPPTRPNGVVHYVIEYKREDSGSWTLVNTTSDSTHYNLTGLHSGTNYMHHQSGGSELSWEE